MDPIQLLASVAGIALTVGIAWTIAPRRGDLDLSEEIVRAKLADEHPDYAVAGITIGSDRRSALAWSDMPGDCAVALTLGWQCVVWRLPPDLSRQARLTGGAEGDRLDIATDDVTRPLVRLTLPAAEGARLAARLGLPAPSRTESLRPASTSTSAAEASPRWETA